MFYSEAIVLFTNIVYVSVLIQKRTGDTNYDIHSYSIYHGIAEASPSIASSSKKSELGNIAVKVDFEGASSKIGSVKIVYVTSMTPNSS